MSNYDEAIKIVDKIYNTSNFTKEQLQPLIDYLNKSETTEKEHEALKKDVAKLMYYFEYKEKWTDELDKSLQFYYYKVLNKVGKE